MSVQKLLKRVFIGRPLDSRRLQHERLSNPIALAIFSSDSLSSVAYATEEILRVLIIAGTAAMAFSLPVAIGIAGLLWIISSSYKQTITAYPSAGGAYIVAKDNLGIPPALLAGAMLMIDYILTVSVSVCAGMLAVISAFPALAQHKLIGALLFIALIAWMNLRGVKESGKIFAVPTYIFILSIFALIIVGLIRIISGDLSAIAQTTEVVNSASTLGLFMILKAFSAGCTALTGVEAISNGVPAFKPNEPKNAIKTLSWMTVILGFMFIGITFLALKANIVPSDHQTVLSQIGRAVFGSGTWLGSVMYFVLQGATMMILVLAANTAYAGFPLLSAFLAKDKFLPRQLMNRGDRLVFSFGIIVLSIAAALFVIFAAADVHRLIAMYAVGVFSAFSLSQVGMSIRNIRRRDDGWKKALLINGAGAVVTTAVLLIILITKFTHGAWLVLLLASLLIALFRMVKSHYTSIAEQLTIVRKPIKRVQHEQTYIIFVSEVHRGTIEAVQHVMDLHPSHVQAVHFNLSSERVKSVASDWNKYVRRELGYDIPLTVVPCPYRNIVEVVGSYLDRVDKEWIDDKMTVVIPQFVPSKFWHHWLHNQTTRRIVKYLEQRPENVNVEVVNYRLQ